MEQVQAFRDFLQQVDEKWTLRLIGCCHASDTDQQYLRQVRLAAGGLPVEIQVDADRGEVIRALAEAKLFWHTGGLSIDEKERPELAEHFGIATVEAMQAACVPIVIASGGQREIVRNGVNGFAVKSISDLVRYSALVVRDNNLMKTMAERAKQRGQRFTSSIFEQCFGEALLDCLKLSKGSPPS
jgi:glycosyltransferase involved in cell wall biosynthesis